MGFCADRACSDASVRMLDQDWNLGSLEAEFNALDISLCSFRFTWVVFVV